MTYFLRGSVTNILDVSGNKQGESCCSNSNSRIMPHQWILLLDWSFLSRRMSVLKWYIRILELQNLRSTRLITMLILGFRELVIQLVRNWAQKLWWIPRANESNTFVASPRLYLGTEADPGSQMLFYFVLYLCNSKSLVISVWSVDPPGQEGTARLFLSPCYKYEGKNDVLRRLLDLRVLIKKGGLQGIDNLIPQWKCYIFVTLRLQSVEVPADVMQYMKSLNEMFIYSYQYVLLTLVLLLLLLLLLQRTVIKKPSHSSQTARRLRVFASWPLSQPEHRMSRFGFVIFSQSLMSNVRDRTASCL